MVGAGRLLRSLPFAPEWLLPQQNTESVRFPSHPLPLWASGPLFLGICLSPTNPNPASLVHNAPLDPRTARVFPFGMPTLDLTDRGIKNALRPGQPGDRVRRPDGLQNHGHRSFIRQPSTGDGDMPAILGAKVRTPPAPPSVRPWRPCPLLPRIHRPWPLRRATTA